MRELAVKLETVPVESVVYHARLGHISNWLKARTEFALAERFQSRDPDELTDPEELRAHLLAMIREHRRDQDRSTVTQFDRDHFEPAASITRIGRGSLGGKARGIAYANHVLRESGVEERFPEIDVHVPPCVVLANDVFDEFIE